ncbi:MAG: acetyl-CoA carboxylase carboxyl transferase subunit alpha [Alphaproteobacteria bacterium]|jgi:acetyl-CoA carboxylase carboxyl transferase subunit alpha
MTSYLNFEKPIADLEGKITELKRLRADGGSVDISDDIERLEAKATQTLKTLYASLDAVKKVQVARHPERPHCLDYIHTICDDFILLAGDRKFGEDEAIIGGFATLNDIPIIIMGHEKGSDLQTRLKHNFGMGKPEGYRKAVRLMELANKFNLPVVTLIDTPGAYPGIGAEERGQAEAIAQATRSCLNLKTPLISVIIGEGGSGGAVSLAVGDYLIMPEHAIYSVISPEGCASILWRDSKKVKDATQALKLTAQDLQSLNIIDEIIPEPVGGAHRDRERFIRRVGKSIEMAIRKFQAVPSKQLVKERRDKFLNISSISA